MIASTYPGSTPAPAVTYLARPADPASAYDISTLALMRWWSVSVTDPGGIDPTSLPGFHKRFVDWWQGSADNRCAALVEECGGPVTVPVAVGWVTPAESLLGEVTWGVRKGRVQGVYVVPGVAHDVVVAELHRVLHSVAATAGLQLVGEP